MGVEINGVVYFISNGVIFERLVVIAVGVVVGTWGSFFFVGLVFVVKVGFGGETEVIT